MTAETVRSISAGDRRRLNILSGLRRWRVRLGHKLSNPDTSGFKNSKPAVRTLAVVGEQFEHCTTQR
jgi:hypothetical protein